MELNHKMTISVASMRDPSWHDVFAPRMCFDAEVSIQPIAWQSGGVCLCSLGTDFIVVEVNGALN